MRTCLAIALMMGLTACNCGQGLKPASGSLAFEPASLALSADAPHGTLRLRSTLPTPLAVGLSVGAPFSVSPASVTLEPNGFVDVELTFSPTEGGHVDALLEARGPEARASASIGGDAPCAATAACRMFVLDAGRCVEQPLADGVTCADPCLDDAHCAAGACVGNARNCADTDVCTVDACQANVGCIHPRCEAISDPCRAGVCSATGCLLTDVDDGTSCGSSDCVEARICLAGACVVRPVPEGAACVAPCGTGRCEAEHCVLPVATELMPVWTLSVGPGANIASPIAVDASGNLYWLEDHVTRDEVVSTTRAGVERWRRVIGAEMRSFSARSLAVDDLHGTLIVDDSRARLHGLRLADGVIAWTRSVISDLVLPPDAAPNDQGYVSRLAVGAVLVAEVFVYAPAGGSPKNAFLVALNPKTGATAWIKPMPSYFYGTVMDEKSNFYERVSTASSTQVVSYDAAGVQRWSIVSPGSSGPRAVFDGRLYLGHGEAFDTAAGASAFTAPLLPDDETTFGALKYVDGSWLASKTISYLSLGQYAAPRAVDPKTGALRWRFNGSYYRPTDAFLTTKGTQVLLDQRYLGTAAGWVWHVSALTSAGREAWACRLPDFGWWDVEGVTLDGERLVVTGHESNPTPTPFPAHTAVASFPLEGYRLSSGWSVSSSGSVARNRRPTAP